VASEVLIGSIFIFAGNFAPRGFAFCNGQLLSIAQNQALFAILGTTYGGDGTQTFALPDLRGRFALGSGTGPGLADVPLGGKFGAPSAQMTNLNLPQHNHLMLCDQTSGPNDDPTGGFPGNPGAQTTPTYWSAGPPNATMAPQALAPAGGDQPFSVQNPMLGISFIIALYGVFPSRN
jgi:microcystin-dependent protein